jgi:hypothetical protein
MTFRLLKKTTGRASTIFHVTDAASAVLGSVNVPREQENDLQKCWAGAHGPPAAKAAVPRVRLPAMSKAAILRGC